MNKKHSPNFKTRKQFREGPLPSELHINKNFLVISQVIRNYSFLRNVALCRIAALWGVDSAEVGTSLAAVRMASCQIVSWTHGLARCVHVDKTNCGRLGLSVCESRL
jgi:hypothetical protein